MPKRQQFHATTELALRDPRISDEEKILRKLRETVNRSVKNPKLRIRHDVRPALYRKYRNLGFPIKTDGNRKYPAWRSLSPWMKLQLASLCIAEHRHVQVRLRLHDAIVEELERNQRDYRSYLRDRMTRILRERFGDRLLFLFVLEDLDRDRVTAVRTHAHGMVMLPPVNLDTPVDGRTAAARERRITRFGRTAVELAESRSLLKDALQAAVGNRGMHSRYYGGVDQASNVWTAFSYNPRFNFEAISYAFKNVDAAMSGLPANRIVRSKGLATEAHRFWDLVRLGEPAIVSWPSD